jgi:hypothetical protein
MRDRAIPEGEGQGRLNHWKPSYNFAAEVFRVKDIPGYCAAKS